MITILKPGEPQPKQFRGRCGRCKTEFTCDERDLTNPCRQDTAGDFYIGWCKCPTRYCSQQVLVVEYPL